MDSSDKPAYSTFAYKVYFIGPYFHQNWSLPDSMIYYLAKNPKSPKCYLKLIKTCKYFFFKNPIIICSNLSFCRGEYTSKIFIRKDGDTKYINLKNVSSNFWITDDIFITTSKTRQRNVMSSLIPNIYKSDIKEISLLHQFISFNELLFLASKADYILLCECTVKDKNGYVVPVEKLIEAFVHVKKYEFDFNENDPSISSKTVENLIKIPHFSSIDSIYFGCIPEVFDIETFYGYMKKNKHTFFGLRFVNSISDAYQNRLEEIIDEIKETENRDYKTPVICCF